MKKLTLIVCLAMSLFAEMYSQSACCSYEKCRQFKTYYIATDGNDDNTGGKQDPFATLRKAQSLVEAGDTVYIRGGVYRLTNDDISGFRNELYHCLFIMDKSGNEYERICYFGVPGERPVFDLGDVVKDEGRISAFWVTGSYLHFRNFEIVGTPVIFSHRNTQSECISNKGGWHNIYENLAMHHGEGIGFYLTSGGDNLVLNCDAYLNCEITQTASGGGRGGNVDGFGCHPSPGDTGNAFRGCRAWFNADDGFDLIKACEVVNIENCWAFYNGFKPDENEPDKFVSLADGNGFKAGGYGMKVKTKCPAVIPMHRVANCIAYRNKQSGFYANHHLGGVDFCNNSAFANRYNFNMICRKSVAEVVDVDGYGHRLANNLSWQASDLEVRALDYDRCSVRNCSFYPSIDISDEDFVSVDDGLLTVERNPDGSLPAIDFLRPTAASAIYKVGMGHSFPSDKP